MKKNIVLYLFCLPVVWMLACGSSSGDPEPVPPGTETPADPGAKHYVSSLAELSALSKGALGAGDTLVWRNGTYADVDIELKWGGEPEKRFVFMAEEGGKVIFTGSSRVTAKGSHTEVSGFWFRDPVTAKNKAILTLATGTTGSVLSGCAITGQNTPLDKEVDYKWVSLYGTGHTVERCSFADKRNIGTLLVVWFNTTEIPAHTIRNNYFSRPAQLLNDEGKIINGQETIRIGTSDFSLQDSGCTVEGNYFYRCDGETETISNKSCANTYRGNLFEECKGTLTLRHGNRCTVEGNYFLGNGVSDTGGVRLVGEEHTVTGNYLENLRGTGYKTAICLVRGQQNPALSGYAQVTGCTVTNNTVVGCRYAVNANYGSGDTQTQPVVNTEIKNNTLVSDNNSDFTIYCHTTPLPNITWGGNTIYGGKQSGISLAVTSTRPEIAPVDRPCTAIRNAAGTGWLNNRTLRFQEPARQRGRNRQR